MDLIVYCRKEDGEALALASFKGKEDFEKYLGEALARRSSFGASNGADKIVALFSQGASVATRQVRALKRALRQFDEVYLCNEIVEALDEVEDDTVSVSLSESPTAIVDISVYDV